MLFTRRTRSSISANSSAASKRWRTCTTNWRRHFRPLMADACVRPSASAIAPAHTSLHRPSYPPAVDRRAVRRLGRSARRWWSPIVGAGTGSRRALFAARGATRRRDRAERRRCAKPRRPIRASRWRDGTAEATALPDASVDVVAAFQAFHWFDHAGSDARARRILAPAAHGRLHTNATNATPFTAGYGEIVRALRDRRHRGAARRRAGRLRPPSLRPRTQRFEFTSTSTARPRRFASARRIGSSYLAESRARRATRCTRDRRRLFDAYERDGRSNSMVTSCSPPSWTRRRLSGFASASTSAARSPTSSRSMRRRAR